MLPYLVFVARRVAASILLLAATSVVLFTLMRIIPGDPVITRLGSNAGTTMATVKELRRELGLNQPIWMQYLHWIGGVVHFDLGKSYFSQTTVSTLIGQRFWPTFELTVATLVLDVLVTVPVAILCAARPNGIFDRLTSLVSSFQIAFPPFVAGILLLLVFSVKLHWLPNNGFVPWSVSPLRNLRSIILPSLTLAITSAVFVLRYLRSQLIEELKAPYIRTAFGKGVGKWRVIYYHALRNALIPALTQLGLIVGYTLGGVVIVEYVFGISGIGSLTVQSAITRDYGVLQSVVLLIACVFVTTSLVVDLVSTLLDPRIRDRVRSG